MIDSSAPPQLALMVANTFDEFCAISPYKDLLKCRYQEANIQADTQLYLTEYPHWLNWVLIVEEDLPDTLVLAPMIQRMAEHAPRSSIYILRAEDDLSLVDNAFDEIDLGEDDLLELEMPLLLFFNEEWQYLSQWGPRPRATEAHLDGWLERHAEFEPLALSEDDADQVAHARLLDMLTYEMRVWYRSQLDHECCKEIHAVLEHVMIEIDSDISEDNEPSEHGDDLALGHNGSDAVDSDDAEAIDVKDRAPEPETVEESSPEESSPEPEAEAVTTNAEKRSSDRRSDKRSNDRKRNNSRRRRKPPAS